MEDINRSLVSDCSTSINVHGKITPKIKKTSRNLDVDVVKPNKNNDNNPNGEYADSNADNSVLSAISVTLIQAKELIDDKKTLIGGYCMMFLCAIVFSFIGVLVKYGNDYGYSGYELVAVRGIGQGSFTLIVMLLTYFCSKDRNNNAKKKVWMPRGKDWFWLVPRGIAGGLFAVGYFGCLEYIQLGSALTVISTYPIFTAFIAIYVLKERLTCIHVFSLVLAIIGVILVEQPSEFGIFSDLNHHHSNKDTTSHHNNLIGYGLALGASLSASLTFVCTRKLKHLNVNTIVMAHSLSCIVIGLIVAYATVGIGFVGFFGQLTGNWGAQHVPAGVSSMIKATDTVWAFIWGFIFFGELPNWVTILGALCVMSGVIFVAIQKYLKQVQKSQPNQ